MRAMMDYLVLINYTYGACLTACSVPLFMVNVKITTYHSERNDAGITGFISPTATPNAGFYNVTATLKNYGTNALNILQNQLVIKRRVLRINIAVRQYCRR